jgi:hypothetical protein
VFFFRFQVLNDFSVKLLTDVAAFAHTNPKSIGSKLQRAVAKAYGTASLLTNGGHGDDASASSESATSTAAAGDASGDASGDGASQRGGGDGGAEGTPDAAEEFDEDDSIAPRTW